MRLWKIITIYIIISLIFLFITAEIGLTLLLIAILVCHYKINKFINMKDYQNI